MVAVGTVLHGYCEGYFGRDGYGPKRIEALGADWVVARYVDGPWEDQPTFANARKGDDWFALLEKWSAEKEPE